MTVPASAREIGRRMPSESEQASANHLRKLLASHVAGEANLRVLDGKKPVEVTLTPGLSELMLELLRHIGKGDAVTLVPVSKMLSTQQAADILNVSRPFLISLLEADKIPFERVNRHRRIRAEDLFAFKAKRDAERSDSLSDLAKVDSGYL